MLNARCSRAPTTNSAAIVTIIHGTLKAVSNTLNSALDKYTSHVIVLCHPTVTQIAVDVKKLIATGSSNRYNGICFFVKPHTTTTSDIRILIATANKTVRISSNCG